MTRFASIKGRLGRAEAAGGAAEPVPCVIRVQPGQTVQAALAAHAAAFPVRPRGFAPLVVPARVPADAEQTWAKRFAASQRQLQSDAKSETLAVILAASKAAPEAPAPITEHVREVIAAAKLPPKTPTFSATQFNHRPLRNSIRALRETDQ